MKLTAIFLVCLGHLAMAYPAAFRRRDVDPSIVPEFGWISGVNPTGTGDCQGAPGTNVEIPCACPPDRTLFLKDLNANIDAGHCVNNTAVSFSFPTDNSVQSQIDRITGVLITLQNLRGPGQGCPAASTTLVVERSKLAAQLSGASPSPNVPASGTSSSLGSFSSPSTSLSSTATPSPQTSSDTSQVAALAPQLGFVAGQNPTGTGDCDGAIPGGPKVPCFCPPDRPTFLTALEANVAAGRAVNNNAVSVSYPFDNSVNSQKSRIIASLITIQNLRGPGVGCPAVSTTLSQQLAALG